MAYSWLDATKDFLGALGPVLIAVPWFYDYNLKRKRDKVEGIQTAGKLSDFKEELAEFLKKKLEAPKARDVLWTLLGLACICVSFLISFVGGVKDLF